MRWARIFATDAGLTVLLVSLLTVVFVIYPFLPLGGAGRFLATVGLTVVLASGVFSLGNRPKLSLAVVGLSLNALISHWLRHATASPAIDAWAYLSTIVFLALTSTGVLARVLRQGRVTPRRIQGAVAVYLMLGLVWGYAYALVELGAPGSFEFPATSGAVPEGVDATTRDLIYFSFVTLTTLGYGDVKPIGSSARTLATLEALVGQLFLVILISRLVSLEVAHSRTEDPEERGSPSKT